MTTTTTPLPSPYANRTPIALRVPDDLFETLTLLAFREQIPRNALITRLLDAAVKADPEALADAQAMAARRRA